MSAALALARKGLRVRVLEKAPEFGEIGYGIQMGPNVGYMLDLLGVLKALEPASVFPKALIFADALTNAELSRIDLGERFVQRYRYRYFVIHRRDLHGGLLKACRERPENVLERAPCSELTSASIAIRLACPGEPRAIRRVPAAPATELMRSFPSTRRGRGCGPPPP